MDIQSYNLGEGFIRDMTPSEAARYRKYWQKNAPIQVPPGTRRLVDQKASRRSKGEVYKRVSHYDEYGRMTGQTHYTSHGEAKIHPNLHHHRRHPITGQGLKNPKSGRKIWAGVHPAENSP